MLKEGLFVCNKRKEKQKEKKRVFQNEERLDSKTACGITDSTPREAVNNMIEEGRKQNGR